MNSEREAERPADNDYPAAHSMDASWYAVDQAGNVALFITGAGGAVPNGAYSPEAADLMEEIDLEEREELGISAAVPAGELPDRRHLFVYETGTLDECLAECYQQRQVPEQPLHVDQLPPQVRQAVGQVRFAALDFRHTKEFQPVELTECSTWDPAYLAGDGKTVKPVPGREREYAQFLNHYREDLEEQGLTLEGPGQQKRPQRGKKKGGDDEA